MIEQPLMTSVLLLLAYLLGSIPTAVWVCRLFDLPDPRKQGSRNPGTSNVLRIGDKLPAAITLLGDGGKGCLALIIAQQLNNAPLFISAITFAVILGHLYPLFGQLKGGKGVATAFGCSLAIFWPLFLLQLICWVAMFITGRIAALASISAILISPIFIWLTAPQYVITFWLIAALLLYSHRKNIINMMVGKEPRF